MSNRKARLHDDPVPAARWRGLVEHLHAEPGRNTGNVYLAFRGRQSGMTK